MPNVRVFARNFRGFRWLYVDLNRSHFLVGDNSAGKSSALHLVDAVLRSRLNTPPKLREDLGVSAYDYFSPFFDYADVSFGVSHLGISTRSAKLVTFRRNKEFQPAPQVVSYAAGDYLFSFKKYAGNIVGRLIQHEGADDSKLLDLHNSPKGFLRKSLEIPGDFDLLEPSIVFFAMSALTASGRDGEKWNAQSKQHFSELARVTSMDLPVPVLVGPVRSLPAKFYERRRTKSSSGLHFASLWVSIEKMKAEGLNKAVNDFGREGNLFDELHVRKVNSKLSDSPLVVTVEKSGKEFFINQLGVGLSQVVPILAEAVFSAASPNRHVFLSQQPELHLHPVAQAALGTFFHEMSKFGLTSILETHSSFMMDRYRSELRDCSGAVGVQPPRILFFENSSNGNSVTSINCNERGELVDPPYRYVQFFLDEIIRTMI